LYSNEHSQLMYLATALLKLYDTIELTSLQDFGMQPSDQIH